MQGVLEFRFDLDLNLAFTLNIRSSIRIGKKLLSDFNCTVYMRELLQATFAGQINCSQQALFLFELNYMDLHSSYAKTAASHIQQVRTNEFRAFEAIETARLIRTSLALTREHFIPNPSLRARVSQGNEKSGHDFPVFFSKQKEQLRALCPESSIQPQVTASYPRAHAAKNPHKRHRRVESL